MTELEREKAWLDAEKDLGVPLEHFLAGTKANYHKYFNLDDSLKKEFSYADSWINEIRDDYNTLYRLVYQRWSK